jgi:hypothetical protein
MSTITGRFGPKIAGWRGKPERDLEPRMCDWPATVYEVSIVAAHGSSSTKFMVLAYDDAQAEEFALLRYPNADGAIGLTPVGPARQYPDFTGAVVRVETPDESLARYMRWMER